MLNANEILNTVDFQMRKIDVPAWNTQVWIRTLSGVQRDEIEQLIVDDKRSNLKSLIAIYSICDEDGKRFFAKDKLRDMNRKSGKALDRVFAEAMELNQMSEDDIEELTQQIKKAHSSGSPTGGQDL